MNDPRLITIGLEFGVVFFACLSLDLWIRLREAKTMGRTMVEMYEASIAPINGIGKRIGVPEVPPMPSVIAEYWGVKAKEEEK